MKATQYSVDSSCENYDIWGKVRPQFGRWGSNFYIEMYQKKFFKLLLADSFFPFTADIKYTKFTNEA